MNLSFLFTEIRKKMNTGLETRDFYPGDEWVFFKLYGGIAICDKILFTHVLPLTNFLESEGTIDKWFFIRYSDPEFHLRIRLHTKDRKKFDLYGWISLMSQLIIINRALYVNKQQEGKICAIT